MTMSVLTFARIFCEIPEKTGRKHAYFFGALGIFVLLALLFWSPLWMDLNSYGVADWDFSNFRHAVPAWSVKYFHAFPLWDPYLRGGTTLIGNPQNPAPFSVTFLMSLLVGPLAGLKWGNIFNAVAGMAGMYVLLGRFNTVWVARILAALLLAFNGTVIYHVSQGQFMWMMTMYWPWMIFFFLKGLDERLWVYPAALMLSLQFWGGGTYPFAFAILIIGFLAVLLALRDKKAGYLLRFAETMGAFVIFSAPRLFMVVETLYRFPRVTLNEDALVPWSTFYYGFLCPDQTHEHLLNLKVSEFSAYVGLIAIVLTVIVFFQWKKFWPYLCILLFSLVMAFGNSPYSPFWPVFHGLGAGYFHFSTRSFLISVFFIAMASGIALSYLVLLWKERFPWIAWIALAGTVFVMGDLFVVLSPVVKSSVTMARPSRDFDPSEDFKQIEVSEKQRYRFGNSSMVDLLLSNTGSSNGYDALPIPSYARPLKDPQYRGEFLLQNGLGKIQGVSWSLDRWEVKLNLSGKDILIVNQNFDPGWKTNPPKNILNVKGLLGVEAGPEDTSIVFYYFPFNFMIGMWVSLMGLIAIGWDIIKFCHQQQPLKNLK